VIGLAVGTSLDADARRGRGGRAVPGRPFLAPPLLLVPPAVLGTGRIGTAHRADPGRWRDAETLGLAWQRDGADIPGAGAADFVPGAADDGAGLGLRVVATNRAGASEAKSSSILVVHPAPAVIEALPDLLLSHHSGDHFLDASSIFTGSSLTFDVTGEGVAVDPATGRITVATDSLRDGLVVTVTASNSGGTAVSRFTLSITAEAEAAEPGDPVDPDPVDPDPVDPDPVVIAPALVAAPALGGSGVIGTAVTLEPGVWSGDPDPDLAVVWLRDGEAIAGATGLVYTPVAADDGAALAARVTASNAAGSAEAVTAPLAVVWPAPAVVVGALAGLALVQGEAPAIVEAAAAFAGEALVFAVEGAGATIDAATGTVTVPTDALLEDALVTVRASNSGGSVEAGFRVDVAAAPVEEPPVEEPPVEVAAPVLLAPLGDLVFEQGSGLRTISAQAGFAGAGLAYALSEAPAGVTINPGSGLIGVPTEAPIAAGAVTVHAANAGGAVSQTFAVTVREAGVVSVFDSAAALDEVTFIPSAGAPSWSYDAGGFCRLVPANTGRTNGDWRRAGGDGRYRALVRWTHPQVEAGRHYFPFIFGAGVSLAGSDFSGRFVEVFQHSNTGTRLRISAYTGTGSVITTLASSEPAWQWNTWYWVEMEAAGTTLRARIYPEGAAAPDWQVAQEFAAPAAGAFGPGAFARDGQVSRVDVRRLEYRPSGVETGPETGTLVPPAAQGSDWTLDQVTVQA
jgi:hypothetical protein